jgi:parallel beta-helix repeat protein
VSVKHNSALEEVEIIDNLGNGVTVFGNGNLISKNRVRRNGLDGIFVNGGSENAVEENGVFENGQDGISVSGSENAVSKNAVGDATIGNRSDGIDVNGTRNSIRENVVSGNLGNGVTALGSDNRLERNAIGDIARGNGGSGILCDGSGCVVSENAVFANGATGVEIRGGLAADPNIVRRNVVGDRNKGNGGDGIFVANDVGNAAMAPAEIDENRVRANVGVGINLAANAIGHQLRGNIAEGNAGVEYIVSAGNVDSGNNRANGRRVVFGPAGGVFP